MAPDPHPVAGAPDLSSELLTAGWSYEFHHPIGRVWPHLTDTDRVNRAIGLRPVDYRDEPAQEGGSRRYGDTRLSGFRVRWHEHPYEWVQHRFMRSERNYLAGALKVMNIHWSLEPTARGCRVDQTFTFQGANWLFDAIARRDIGGPTRRRFLDAFARIDRFLDETAAPFAWPPDPGHVADPAAVEALRARLRSAGVDEDVAQRLAVHCLGASPLDLVRMRPVRLARTWGIEPRRVIAGALHAARAGLLEVSWDLVCPSCGGDSEKSASLAELDEGAHCDSCNIEYDARFDESVELTFSVAPSVREVNVGRYCIGGPQNTPHFLLQLRLRPGSERAAELELPAGVYVLRSLQSRDRWVLKAADGAGTSEVDARYTTGEGTPAELGVRAGRVLLRLRNETPHEIVAILERADWLEDVCTAAYVTSLQSFRDLFAAEVLRPGQELAIRSIALLFTDLKGSTNLYHRVGDATAFSLVRDHFDILLASVAKHDGGIVKTIGDAIMAAFTRPRDAVAAALDIHRSIHAHNASHPGEDLTLKIGIHFGSCFAVTLNERLDYFGSTVNIAARTEGQCAGDDIVLSHATHEAPGVRELIAASGLPVEETRRALKGFDEQFHLYRIDCRGASL